MREMSAPERLQQLEECCLLHDRSLAALALRLCALEDALKGASVSPPDVSSGPRVKRRAGRAAVIVLPPLPPREGETGKALS